MMFYTKKHKLSGLKKSEKLLNEKLELEIKVLQKSWWKKPQYIAAISPILIAVISFIALLLSGFFNSRVNKLNNQVNKLEILRDSISNEIVVIRDSLNLEHVKLNLINDSIINLKYQINYERKAYIMEKVSKIELEMEKGEFMFFKPYYKYRFSSDKIKFFTSLQQCETLESFLKTNHINFMILKGKFGDEKFLGRLTFGEIGVFIGEDKYKGSIGLDNSIIRYNRKDFQVNEKGKLAIDKEYLKLRKLIQQL